MAIKGKDNKMVQSRNYSDGRVSRTKVRRHFTWRSTFSSGYLLPIFADEVYPGQVKSINMGELIRSITPLGPTMDNSYFDVFFFFVPNRLIWDHWEEFIAGYNKEAWTQDVVYQVPQIKFKNQYDNGVYSEDDTPVFQGIKLGPDETLTTYSQNMFVHSWLDYLPGAFDPVNVAGVMFGEKVAEQPSTAANVYPFSISALYPRAYVKIWNDWFRDENLQDELELYTGDNDEYADEFAFDLLNPTAIPKAAKYHNRFTSALPAPQKGPDVLIPMQNLQVGAFATASGSTSTNEYAALKSGTSIVSGNFYQFSSILGSNSLPSTDMGNVVANNVTNTIRMLRLATQTELLLARDARGGTRYVESLLSHFGVHNGDARLQRSEYLGSKQIPLQIMQVTNTAASESNPLGNVGAQSVTKDNSHYFTKAFTEHGILLCVATVRTNISYSSGIRKMYHRKDRFDFIWPEFKHIGDVPIYNIELACVYGTSTTDKGLGVFGYTPYGSELREGYNFNNGLFRAQVNGSLSYLTYQETSFIGSEGETLVPQLSASYIEQPDVIKNTLVDQLGPEFYALFDLVSDDVIPLDPTSDPGLMDHF